MNPIAPARTPDPTAVVGRRIVAAVIDVGILLAFSVSFWLLASEQLPDLLRGLDVDPCTGQGLCTSVNDRYVEGWPLVLLGAMWLVYLVGVFVLQRGLTGRTVGTMLMGVVTVGPDGRPLGPGRAFVRSVAGIVDYLPCCVPIVGLVTVMATPAHRRVGDMAAASYVVGAEWFGRPVELPRAAAPEAPAPPPVTGYPAQPPTAPVPRPPVAPVAPAQPVPSASAVTLPPATPPTAPAAPPTEPTPASTGPFTPPQPGPAAPTPSVAASTGDGPVWDAERRAYLQWDQAREQWLQFDQATQEWQQYDPALGRWRPVDR